MSLYTLTDSQRQALAVRFWQKVIQTPGDCWHWDGGYNGCGYGAIRSAGRGPLIYVHRLSYELHHGPIPYGMVIHHVCGIRGCVNPAHLEAVEPSLNLCYQGWWACVR